MLVGRRRLPAWLAGLLLGVFFVAVMTVIEPVPGRMLLFRLLLWSVPGLVLGIGGAVISANSLRSIFQVDGVPLSPPEQAIVVRVVRGEMSSQDPRLLQAAGNLARRWSSMPTRLLPVSFIALALAEAFSAIRHPTLWLMVALYVAFVPWAVTELRRRKSDGQRFLSALDQNPRE